MAWTWDWEQIRNSTTMSVEIIEGPYKWYIVAAVVLILSALITQFIFKTFKWFLLIIFGAVLIGGAFLYFRMPS